MLGPPVHDGLYCMALTVLAGWRCFLDFAGEGDENGEESPSIKGDDNGAKSPLMKFDENGEESP